MNKEARELKKRRQAWNYFVKSGLRFRKSPQWAAKFGKGFSCELRNRIRKTIRDAYLKPLTYYCRERGYNEADINQLLGLHSARQSRKHLASLDTFLQTLAFSQVDVEEVGFPRGDAVAWHGICSGMAYVQQTLEQDPEDLPDREEWRCVRTAMANYDLCEVYQLKENPDPGQQAEGEKLKHFVYRSIAEALVKHDPRSKIRTWQQVEAVVAVWWIPVLLFHTVIPAIKKDFKP
jgi:hypothetical protein